jgi:hypothetical protein
MLKEYIFWKDIDMKRKIIPCILLEAVEIKEYFLVCYEIMIYFKYIQEIYIIILNIFAKYIINIHL